jgi:TRAP-type C4-dicarboxylate transport system permease large subunit
MKLVKHWRALWKSYSVIFSTLIVGLASAKELFPIMQTTLDAKTFGMITIVLGVATVMGRYIEQQNIAKYKEELKSEIQDKAE